MKVLQNCFPCYDKSDWPKSVKPYIIYYIFKSKGHSRVTRYVFPQISQAESYKYKGYMILSR